MNKSRLLEASRAGAADPFHAAKYHGGGGKKGGGDNSAMAMYSLIASQNQAAAMERVSDKALALGQEQFEWGKEQADKQWSLLGPLVDAQLEQLRKAGARDEDLFGLEQQLRTEYLDQMQFTGKVQEEGYAQAQERYGREKEMYWPVEEQFVKEAQGYDTAARREEEVGRAAADVTQAFEANRASEQRRLEGMGLDPSQGAQRGLSLAGTIGQATAQAGAETGARRRVEDVGRAMRADVVNLGRGLPSNVAGSYGLALSAGQQGIGAGQAAVGNAAGTVGSAAGLAPGYASIGGQYGSALSNMAGLRNSGLPYFGTALGGYGGAGGLYQGAAAGYNQIDQINAQQNSGFWGGLGSLAGMALGSVGGTQGWGRYVGLDDGGRVRLGRGGPVRGVSDGSGIDDRIPARLSAGEYVVPADVVEAKGVEFFDKLRDKYHTPASVQRRRSNTVLPAYSDGGERREGPRHERQESRAMEQAEDAIEILPIRQRRRLITQAMSELGLRV